MAAGDGYELLYESPSGDRWLLGIGTLSGGRCVRHEPNAASGGKVTETDVQTFIMNAAASPELEALLEAMGSDIVLVETEEPKVRPPVSAAQIRAGRGLLGWSVDRLAHEAHVGLDEVWAVEAASAEASAKVMQRVTDVLELGGVMFIGEGQTATGGPGVRMGSLGTSTGQSSEQAETNDNAAEDIRSSTPGAVRDS